jgi:CRP/FNR family transcriptional regulator, cyclic AMP receptor protein
VIPKNEPGDAGGDIVTTRFRVSFFIERFRTMGFIDFKNRLEVPGSLLNVLLRGLNQTCRSPTLE